MKIVILKSRLNHTGGLEKYTNKLAASFSLKGHETCVLSTGDSREKQRDSVIHLMQTSKVSVFHHYQFNKLCKRWLKNHSQDIVFGMERTTDQTHYRAGSGVHAIYLKQRTFTDSFFKRSSFFLNPLHLYLLKAEKKAFENPALRRLFTNSFMVKKEILENFEIDEKKISVVHNGVEWREWESCFKKSLEISKPDNKYNFLFVGNGYHRKGLSFLLKALGVLKERDFHLTVVGSEKNPKIFFEEVENLGLKKKITFKGPQKDLRPFYSRADALIIPSIYDPFANVTVEALAMGLFVVTSPYNGGKEVLEEKSGIIIEDLADPESFAMALRKAMKRPKTKETAHLIRSSIKELDFSNQLDKIIHQSCNT